MFYLIYKKSKIPKKSEITKAFQSRVRKWMIIFKCKHDQIKKNPRGICMESKGIVRVTFVD